MDKVDMVLVLVLVFVLCLLLGPLSRRWVHGFAVVFGRAFHAVDAAAGPGECWSGALIHFHWQPSSLAMSVACLMVDMWTGASAIVLFEGHKMFDEQESAADLLVDPKSSEVDLA